MLTAGDTFQMRYNVHFSGNQMVKKNVYIKSTEIVYELPCKKVQDITVDDALTTNNIIALDWTDVNISLGTKFVYAVREKGTEQWSAYKASERETGLSAPGLKGHTTYQIAVRAVCGAGDSSDAVIKEAATYYGAPYKQNFTGLSDLPADYQKATAVLIQEGKPSFSDGNGDWWQDEPMGSYLLGINGKSNNSWLLFPTICLDTVPGDVTLDFAARAFYKNGQSEDPVFDTCKTKLYIVAASTKDSLNGNHVIDTVDLVADLTTDWSKVQVDLSAYTKHTQLAFFLLRDENNAASKVYLQIDSIDIDYRSVTCLGVSNVQTGNLTATGVTISWEGTALEYGVFYTNATTSDEDTSYTTGTSVTLENLDENTTYTYYIQPYCGENHTNPGPASSEDFFNTPEKTGVIIPALQKDFAVSSNAGRISILNPSALKIDRVYVVSTTGAMLQQNSVRTSGNVLLPTIKTPQVVVVKVASGGNEYIYKILVK
jgi:hypothetical protein